MNIKKILVNTLDGKYPILIGKNITPKLKNILDRNNIFSTKILLVIDNKVPSAIIKKIKKSFKKKIFLIYLTSNERNKSQKNVDKIINILLKNKFNRNDCLISIGGGIIGDLSAYAASIFKRGLSYVSVPTTLLAQVDSSIGGKTGINSKYGKNLIGSFYQPKLVVSDISFLKSLPKASHQNVPLKSIRIYQAPTLGLSNLSRNNNTLDILPPTYQLEGFQEK